MSLEDFEITKNDSLPSLQYTISRDGSGSTTPNLTNYSVSLKVRELGSTYNNFSITVTSSGNSNGQITYPTSGIVLFAWSTSHWSSSGTFVGEVSFASSAGKIETAPDRQLFTVKGEY